MKKSDFDQGAYADWAKSKTPNTENELLIEW